MLTRLLLVLLPLALASEYIPVSGYRLSHSGKNLHFTPLSYA